MRRGRGGIVGRMCCLSFFFFEEVWLGLWWAGYGLDGRDVEFVREVRGWVVLCWEVMDARRWKAYYPDP